MHILHVYDHTEPLQSGYVFRSQTLRKSLERKGYKCDILSSVRQYQQKEQYTAGEDSEKGIIYHRTKPHRVKIPILREILDILFLSQKIRHLIRHASYDIIHAHSPCLCGYAIILAKLFTREPIKYVYEIRAFWEDAAIASGKIRENSFYYKMLRYLELFLCKKVDHVYVLCQGIQNDLLQRGISEDKITIIPNAIEVPQEKPHITYPTLLAKSLSISKETILLGFIGSFYSYEGLVDFIPTAEALIELNPHYQFLWVGDGDAMQEIKQKIASSLLKDHFILTGRVPHKQIHDYYTLCDTMIYPRIHTRLTEVTTPLKPLEAMIHKKLVFARDISGHQELIQNGKTGILWPLKEAPEETAWRINRIMQDKELVKKIIETAFDTVTKEKNADVISQKYYHF